MLRHIFAFLFLIAIPANSYAQDINYYIQAAETSENDIQKLIAMDSVLAKSFRVNPELFVDYSFKYVDLAKSIDSIEWAAKKAMNVQYALTNERNEPKKAIKLINGVLARKYKIKDSFLLGGLYLKRGGANFAVDLERAIEDFNLAIENFGQQDSIYIADAHLFSGQAYSNLGQFVNAGDSYQLAYDFFEKLKDYEYMLHSRQGTITMFSMNGFYDMAKEERDALVEKIKELGITQYLTTEYYNQALDYRKMGDIKNHIKYLRMAKKNLQQTDERIVDLTDETLINSRMAEYYCQTKQLDSAKVLISYLDELYPRIQNIPFTSGTYFGAKAIYAETIGNNEEAIFYAKEKLKSAAAINFEDEIIDSHDLLAKIYDRIGDYKKSLEHKGRYAAMKDSIYNKNSANALAYYQTLYETEKKEKELSEKNSSIQLLEKDNETFKKLVAFSSVAIMLLFGLILLYRNQQNLKYKKVLQEKFSQKLLVSQEKERRRISKDLHDGLGQRLLLLKNKLINSGAEDTKELVDATIDEVRTISRDLHPFQLQELGITKAIEYTLNQVDENTSLFISTEIDNIDDLFNREQEVNIYRIVQESISNVIKHAKAEASKVSVKKGSHHVKISVKDNGIGFDFPEKYQNITSLGLKTLLERTKFLNGQMKVQSKIDDGTTLEFQFPIS